MFTLAFKVMTSIYSVVLQQQQQQQQLSTFFDLSASPQEKNGIGAHPSSSLLRTFKIRTDLKEPDDSNSATFSNKQKKVHEAKQFEGSINVQKAFQASAICKQDMNQTFANGLAVMMKAGHWTQKRTHCKSGPFRSGNSIERSA